MKRVLRTVWDNGDEFLMGLLTVLTMGTGLVIGNPYGDTFASGKGWDYFAALRLGPIHPTEDQWGVAFFFLGLFQLLTMWQLSNIRWLIEQGELDDRADFVAYKFTRLIWGITASIYAGLAMSFFVSNPVGIATLWVGIPGVVCSGRICVRVRQTIEAAGEAARRRGGK